MPIIVFRSTLNCLQPVESSFFSCSSSVGVGSFRRSYIFKSVPAGIMSETEFVHYDHNDPCQNARWTARECYQFMYSGRPWESVHRFYLDVINDRNRNLENSDTLTALLLKLNSNDSDIQVSQQHYHKPQSQSHSARDGVSGRWARLTFKIVLSYHGPSFDGWQKQPGLHTVQSVIESSLGKFVDEKKAQLLQSKGLPIEPSVVVAGRTDKGVTALQQVCSFYTWRKDVQPQDIEAAINNAAAGKIRVMSVSQVSRDFHPNFSAEWRRYLYIFPLNDRENLDLDRGNLMSSLVFTSTAIQDNHNGSCKSNMENTLGMDIDCKDETENMVKPHSFSVRRVNQILQQLEGKLLSYKLFARDTKASRNIGPPTECFVYHARAAEARLPIPDHGEGIRAMCVELVANRFLRKMVRVLVATSIREAAAGAEEDTLIKLMDATCRRATAPPAPPDGLCLVDVGYGKFSKNSCLIPHREYLKTDSQKNLGLTESSSPSLLL